MDDYKQEDYTKYILVYMVNFAMICSMRHGWGKRNRMYKKMCRRLEREQRRYLRRRKILGPRRVPGRIESLIKLVNTKYKFGPEPIMEGPNEQAT